ncbi:MAG: hypothetical protein H6822_02535 [Planctomycetaceae bacterium]|nr:hypothetical protein [Planctomycetaceae bacterium]
MIAGEAALTSKACSPTQGSTIRPGKFFVLLGSLLVLLVGAAFLEGGQFSDAGFCALLTGVLLVAVVSVCRRHNNLGRGLALTIPTVVLNWIGYATGRLEVFLAHDILIIFFFVFVAYHVFRAVLDDRHVTLDTIGGAACVYLLVGLAWTYVYGTILLVDGGSIRFATPTAVNGVSPFGSSNFAETAYFSFVTMTTLGYGDVTPTSPPARTAAYLQAVFGQFYLAVLVARLVSLHIVQMTRDQK